MGLYTREKSRVLVTPGVISRRGEMKGNRSFIRNVLECKMIVHPKRKSKKIVHPKRQLQKIVHPKSLRKEKQPRTQNDRSSEEKIEKDRSSENLERRVTRLRSTSRADNLWVRSPLSAAPLLRARSLIAEQYYDVSTLSLTPGVTSPEPSPTGTWEQRIGIP